MKRFQGGWTLILSVLLLLLPMVSQAEIFTGDQPPYEDWNERKLLRMTALDVDQGDALLLECGGETMMVDGGPAVFRQYLKEEIEKRGITHFKYLLNTHYHDDHIMGLIHLMRYGFEVDTYVHGYSDRYRRSNEFQKMAIHEVEKHHIGNRKVVHGDQLTLGDAVMDVYRYNEIKNANARSLVLHVHFGDATVLLTGDIIGKTQVWLTQNIPADGLKADIVKYPHHGVTPMNSEFMDVCDPQVVLLTTRSDMVTKAKHQHEGRGIPAFYSGDAAVTFETDGKDWYICQEKIEEQ